MWCCASIIPNNSSSLPYFSWHAAYPHQQWTCSHRWKQICHIGNPAFFPFQRKESCNFLPASHWLLPLPLIASSPDDSVHLPFTNKSLLSSRFFSSPLLSLHLSIMRRLWQNRLWPTTPEIYRVTPSWSPMIAASGCYASPTPWIQPDLQASHACHCRMWVVSFPSITST